MVGDVESKSLFLGSSGLPGSCREGKMFLNFIKWQKVSLSVVINISMLAHISKDGWIQSSEFMIRI